MRKVHSNMNLNQPAIDGDLAKSRIRLTTPYNATCPNTAALK